MVGSTSGSSRTGSRNSPRMPKTTRAALIMMVRTGRRTQSSKNEFNGRAVVRGTQGPAGDAGGFGVGGIPYFSDSGATSTMVPGAIFW